MINKPQNKKYGWIRDRIDVRDLTFSVSYESIKNLPEKVDLRSQFPPVYDQGSLGSCSANSIGGAFEFDLLKQGLNDFTPSRLFIYYNERALEGTINEDSGAMLRDGIKTLNQQGVCAEILWPYDIQKFKKQPSKECYLDALKHKSVLYRRVPQTLEQLQAVLASGFPIVFGFTVYESFESQEVAETGIVPMPKPNEQYLGGHAVILVGYDNEKQCFLVRNSWGENWGQGGYFWMPYDYVCNPGLASDFWVINSIQSENDAHTPIVENVKKSLLSKIVSFIKSIFNI